MNTKQWELYNFIKDRTEKNLTTDVGTICSNFPNYYQVKITKGNYSNCPRIYEDVEEINNSHEVEKIIVVKNNNFRIGNEEEVIRYESQLTNRAIKLLVKCGNVRRKRKANGQGKLISDQNVAIDENSKARRFVESYLG